MGYFLSLKSIDSKSIYFASLIVKVLNSDKGGFLDLLFEEDLIG